MLNEIFSGVIFLIIFYHGAQGYTSSKRSYTSVIPLKKILGNLSFLLYILMVSHKF
jgi:hypothetical protein